MSTKERGLDGSMSNYIPRAAKHLLNCSKKTQRFLILTTRALSVKYSRCETYLTTKWPVNPVDVFIGKLKGMSASKVVADFGCGEARLSAVRVLLDL